MRRLLPLLLLLGGPDPLTNAYERVKNGPPLTNVFHKARASWIRRKLTDPRHHPHARMPDLKLTDDEVAAAMAYLYSIRDASFPKQSWPAFATKALDDMTEDEFVEMDEAVERGKAVWGDARCTICHAVRGAGGFVDLRVGGIDMHDAALKLDRDWLYDWLSDPKRYFPDTLMPRFRLTDAQKRDLIEYILRGEPFGGEEEIDDAPYAGDPDLVERGRDVIVRSRCVVCHDIEGIPEILPKRPLPPEPPKGTFEWIAWDVRCLTCHTIEGRGGTYAPDLTSEGSRLRAEWIADFVEKPDLIRPHLQQMPRFFLSGDEAKTIAEHMASSRTSKEIPEDFEGGDAAAGARLFEAKGCRACHAVDDKPGGVAAPDLRNVPARLRPGYVLHHLLHQTDPEPDYGLTEEEARDLAAFLLKR